MLLPRQCAGKCAEVRKGVGLRRSNKKRKLEVANISVYKGVQFQAKMLTSGPMLQDYL